MPDIEQTKRGLFEREFPFAAKNKISIDHYGNMHDCWIGFSTGYGVARSEDAELIAQLVGALKTCGMDYGDGLADGSMWYDDEIVDAALAAAKERGYE